MPQVPIIFYELEKWEEEYLAQRLTGIKELKLKSFSSPVSQKLSQSLSQTEILGVFIYSQLDASILAQLPKLKFIATMSTGYDHIDLKACRQRGVKVSNVPFYGENTVAEHTFALILALTRKLPESINRAKTGDFRLPGLRGIDLAGKTLGLVGLGHIGQHVARMAKGFELNLLAFDPRPDQRLAKRLGVRYVTLEYLLSHSDIISLHAPDNQQTHHLISRKNIQLVKRGAYLINTARGGLVETEALLLALDKKILAGAGLDVLEEECFIKEEKELLTKPFQKQCNLKTVLEDHLLLQDPRVLITPHNAFNSEEALRRILDTTVDNIQAYLKGKPINLVK